MEIQALPERFMYDVAGVFYFELYPDNRMCRVYHDRDSIKRKLDDSLYSAYFRAKNGECTIYCAYICAEGRTAVERVDDLEAMADSLGIDRPTSHRHDIRFSYAPKDPGKGRYAELEVEFLCGCTLSSYNKRIMAEYFKKEYGLWIILNSINSEPLQKRVITVERSSIKPEKLNLACMDTVK